MAAEPGTSCLPGPTFHPDRPLAAEAAAEGAAVAVGRAGQPEFATRPRRSAAEAGSALSCTPQL